jgi:hypothetical protein
MTNDSILIVDHCYQMYLTLPRSLQRKVHRDLFIPGRSPDDFVNWINAHDHNSNRSRISDMRCKSFKDVVTNRLARAEKRQAWLQRLLGLGAVIAPFVPMPAWLRAAVNYMSQLM